MTILIIDDSDVFRIALKVILEKNGHNEILSANSGLIAIEVLNDSLNSENVSNIDIILLDVMMPELDGIGTLKLIKNRKEFANIPVIMVSADDQEEKIEEAFKEGAIDYISKPIRHIDLQARVNSNLRLKFEMDQRIAREIELKQTVAQLQDALTNIKTLKKLLPICAHCKKIRQDDGYWEQVDNYIRKNSEFDFSHSICPDCMEKYYSDFLDDE